MATKQKDTLDRFYTNPEAVAKLISETPLDWAKAVYEPCAGQGHIYDLLPEQTRIGSDLCPPTNASNGIGYNNAFNIQCEEKSAVVSNFPFGVRNQLNDELITHFTSQDNVKLIALVLPDVYRKHSMQKVFSRDWALITSTKLPRDSFIFEGKPYHVPAVYQVWVRKEEFEVTEDLRWEEKPTITHPHFEFSTQPADMYVMGAGCAIKAPDEVGPTNRGYWLKSNIPLSELRENISNVPWDNLGCSSANGGVYWITKPEFVKHYGDFNASSSF